MRLLRLEANCDFSLVENVDSHIQRYAMLSHTWGADHEEVAFKDLTEGTGKNKAGYRKLTFCGKQASKDGLQYFWVDTCCIDKSSSAELSEAINSMFRWYHNAAKCYVYLSDVSVGSADGNDPSTRQTWELSFQCSKWFTRGWTLQELIAPTSVEFFSVEGVRLGDKDSMMQEIHKITGISIPALQGSPLSRFSVEERMSWAVSRKTTREEDAAYSLLGIFDIQMALLYGEGRDKAFRRLQREIEYISSVENLFQRNQEVLRETQRLVLQQRATADTQLLITYITMPLVIVMVLFSSMPSYWIMMPFRVNWASFMLCYLVAAMFLLFIRLFIRLLAWMALIAKRPVIDFLRRNTPSTLSHDGVELQNLPT